MAVTKELCGWKGQKVFYLVLLEKLSQLLSQSHSLTGPSKAEPFALFPLPRMPSIVFFFSSLFKVLFLFTLFFKVFVFVFFLATLGSMQDLSPHPHQTLPPFPFPPPPLPRSPNP